LKKILATVSLSRFPASAGSTPWFSWDLRSTPEWIAGEVLDISGKQLVVPHISPDVVRGIDGSHKKPYFLNGSYNPAGLDEIPCLEGPQKHQESSGSESGSEAGQKAPHMVPTAKRTPASSAAMEVGSIREKYYGDSG